VKLHYAHGAMKIRRATITDADVLATLLGDYLRESYPGHPGSTAEQLRRDVLGEQPRHNVLLASVADTVVGFVAWDPIYDMHWAARGMQVADLYVVASHRGLGVALALVARLAAEGQAEGALFLRGGAYDRESTRRAYARVGVVLPSGETNVGGRAFRRLAELSDKPIRELLRSLPPVEWNYVA
jgi:GNAT superfamily N-acetyltransferase